MIPSIISFILSIVAYGISQLQQHGKLRWTKSYNGFWGEESDKRKYKKDLSKDPLGYDLFRAPDNWYYRFFKIKYKERFPLSSTFLVAFTDGYHHMQFWMFIFLSIGISLSIQVPFYYVWPGVLLINWLTRRLLSKNYENRY